MNKKSLQFAIFLTLFVVVIFLRNETFVVSLDGRIYYLAQQFSYSHYWLVFWEGVSAFGRGEFVYVLCALSGLSFLFHYRRRASLLYLVAMTALFLLNPLLKMLFHLDRPVSLSPFSDLSTYTFPSGHAFNSVVLCYFLPRFTQYSLKESISKFYLSPFFMVIGIALIGLSRIFLGAHWFSDVIGGWLHGAAVSTLLLIIVNKFSLFKRAL